MKVNELLDVINSSVNDDKVLVSYGSNSCNYLVDIPKECPEFWEEIMKLKFVYYLFDTTLSTDGGEIVHPFRKGFFTPASCTLNLLELSQFFTELYNEIQATYSDDVLDPNTIAQSIGL